MQSEPASRMVFLTNAVLCNNSPTGLLCAAVDEFQALCYNWGRSASDERLVGSPNL